MRAVTQRDLANHLGINASSVSRALRNDAQVSPSLAKKVQQAAKELGYQPDPAVAALARYRWEETVSPKGLTLALLTDLPTSQRTGFNDLFAAAKRSGYFIDLMDLNSISSLRVLLRMLNSRGIAGVLHHHSVGVEQKSVDLIRAVSERYPAVNWNCRLAHPLCPGVLRDAYHRVSDCCEVVANKGYERVAIILPGHPDHPNEMFRQMQAAWQINRRHHAGWEEELFYTHESWDELAEKLCVMRPEALIVANEDILTELGKRGFKPYEDFAFACMAVLEGRSYSGIRSPTSSTASYCIELIERMIGRRTVGTQLAWIQVEVRGEWVEGDSL
jgi:DNA-binding LacI/PurR family transcriptional regulator